MGSAPSKMLQSRSSFVVNCYRWPAHNDPWQPTCVVACTSVFVLLETKLIKWQRPMQQ